MLGRLLGMTVLVLSVVMASGEGVMAVGTGTYDSLAVGEVWTLLSGHPALGDASLPWMRDVMHLPAWSMTMAFGLMLCFAYRRRTPKRRMMFRTLP
ncbi:hypothetical protein SAMN05421779_102609 [Insolitispirillum peregrinum]|uniref:Uncharacterized protein n=2 Tax=Insolitispirillum peregrinum TaxID=80876 RepID=A0A1N7K593_9PROT|nr:hypothetical protein SAMN05421779_102609 [Insolitispirillum peregrinum]